MKHFFSPLRKRLLLLSLAAGAGCAGPAAPLKKTLNEMMSEQNFSGAEAFLEKAKENGYGPSNAVLYHLDMGMILHQAGQYRRSNDHFQKAEDRMDELFTISMHRAAGAGLANENVQDYPGEHFERALVHLFHALNYVFLGQLDEALVEARRVESFLDELGRAGPGRTYNDDALVHALAALLYEDAGKKDDARISHLAAQKAYERYAAVYRVQAPRFELPTDFGGDGEVVFIHYNGPAPRKISRSSQNTADPEPGMENDKPEPKGMGWSIFGKLVNISHPEFRREPFVIAGSEIEAGDLTASTQLYEDISAIARKDLAERIAGLKSRSAVRGGLKLLGTLAGVDASGSEFADVRSWATLPSQIRLGRLKLKPGRYDVKVVFRDAAGAAVLTHVFPGVNVSLGHRTYLAYRTIR